MLKIGIIYPMNAMIVYKIISKDIEILSWHAVSQLFTKAPLENLSNSLSTFEYIVTHFWESLHPKAPESKLKGESDTEKQKEWAEGRIKPLLQLVGDTAESGLLYMPLQMQVLIDDIDYAKYFTAEKNGSLSQLKEKAMQALAIEKEAVSDQILALGRIHEALVNIESTLSDQCIKVGAQGVSFKFVKSIVEKIINSMKYMVGDGFAKWPLDKDEPTAVIEEISETSPQSENLESVQNDVPTEQSGREPHALATHYSHSEMNRDQAFVELQRIADYFLKAEPHSPVYLLLKRAIRWGSMSLPELLDELVGDDASVQYRISQLAGMESADHVSSIKVDKPNDQPGFSPVTTQPATVEANKVADVVGSHSDEPSSFVEEALPSVNQETESSQDDSASSVASFQW